MADPIVTTAQNDLSKAESTINTDIASVESTVKADLAKTYPGKIVAAALAIGLVVGAILSRVL